MPERKYRSEAEWQALIAAQVESGQGALDFCRDHGLYAKTFYQKRKALRKKGLVPVGDAGRREAFVQVKPTPVRRMAPQPGSVLQYQGSRLHLSAATDPKWLATLMKALP